MKDPDERIAFMSQWLEFHPVVEGQSKSCLLNLTLLKLGFKLYIEITMQKTNRVSKGLNGVGGTMINTPTCREEVER